MQVMEKRVSKEYDVIVSTVQHYKTYNMYTLVLTTAIGFDS